MPGLGIRSASLIIEELQSDAFPAARDRRGVKAANLEEMIVIILGRRLNCSERQWISQDYHLKRCVKKLGIYGARNLSLTGLWKRKLEIVGAGRISEPLLVSHTSDLRRQRDVNSVCYAR